MGCEEYSVPVGEDINADGQVDALLLRRGHSYVPEGQLYPLNASWIRLNKVKPKELLV